MGNKKYRLLKLTGKKAEIELPSLNEIFRVPLDILRKFSNKKVKITIEMRR